jgi:hypothetical protein
MSILCNNIALLSFISKTTVLIFGFAIYILPERYSKDVSFSQIKKKSDKISSGYENFFVLNGNIRKV